MRSNAAKSAMAARDAEIGCRRAMDAPDSSAAPEDGPCESAEAA